MYPLLPFCVKRFAYGDLLIATEPLIPLVPHWPVTCTAERYTIQDCFVLDCPALRFLPTQLVKAPFLRRRAQNLEEYRMKSLLRVLFVLALFCGVASHAHA